MNPFQKKKQNRGFIQGGFLIALITVLVFGGAFSYIIKKGDLLCCSIDFLGAAGGSGNGNNKNEGNGNSSNPQNDKDIECVDEGCIVDAPGNSENAPGQNQDESPGNSENAPGQNQDESPGNSENAPGQNGENPGNSGNTPAANNRGGGGGASNRILKEIQQKQKVNRALSRRENKREKLTDEPVDQVWGTLDGIFIELESRIDKLESTANRIESKIDTLSKSNKKADLSDSVEFLDNANRLILDAKDTLGSAWLIVDGLNSGDTQEIESALSDLEDSIFDVHGKVAEARVELLNAIKSVREKIPDA